MSPLLWPLTIATPVAGIPNSSGLTGGLTGGAGLTGGDGFIGGNGFIGGDRGLDGGGEYGLGDMGEQLKPVYTARPLISQPVFLQLWPHMTSP